MVIYEKLQQRLLDFLIEPVTLNNLSKYENIFYSNDDYFMITDGRAATKQDCIETIEYADNFPIGMCQLIGFSKHEQAIAFLSLLEGYPRKSTLYIGLFLIDKQFQKNSIGTKIINEVIDMAFTSGFKTLKLSVQDNNVSGYSFWQKLGFKSVKRTKCDGFYNISMKLNRSWEKRNENKKIT